MRSAAWWRGIGAGGLALVAAGCSVGPEYRAPAIDTGQWVEPPANDETVVTRWWEQFDDATLDAMVAEAVTANHDIRLASARLAEARAQVGEARSGLLPSIGLGAGAVQEQASEQGASAAAQLQSELPAGAIGLDQDVYQAGFDARWELDLFGGTRRGVEAALARQAQLEADRRDVLVSVLAEVARAYVRLRGEQRRMALLEENVRLQTGTLELVAARVRIGLASDLDLALARSQLAATEARVPPRRAEIRANLYRLAVLLGQRPESLSARIPPVSVSERKGRDSDSSGSALQRPAGSESATGALQRPLALRRIADEPVAVPLGLRSELLRRRPDLQAAERALAAATADVGVSVAELFPSLALTGAYGLEALALVDLFDGTSTTWRAGANVELPRVWGGGLRARIAASEARTEQALIRYEQAVLQALEEVEANLVGYREAVHTVAHRREATAQADEAARLANALFERGLESFLTVLDAEQRQVEAAEGLVQAEIAARVRLIALYKALGGGWEVFSDPPSRS